MTLKENIAKFSKVVKAHPQELSQEKLSEVVRSIVIADTAHIGDADRGKYEHLHLNGVDDCEIAEFVNICVGCNHAHYDVSDVMQMRIMCDALTLLLNGDQSLAMRYSYDVAKAIGQRQRTAKGRYLEFDECESILDSYYESEAGFDESLRPIFERTSYYLKELKRLQPRLDPKQTAIVKGCASSVWLPSAFDSSGFDVQVKMPKTLENARGNIASFVETYNCACIIDICIRAITRDGHGDSAKWAFLNRLQDMSGMSPSAFPIGVGIDPGYREDVYVPYHFLDNQALRVVYSRHFTKDSKASMSGVDALFAAIKIWLGVV